MGRTPSAADGRPAFKDPSPCSLASPRSLHGFTLGPSAFFVDAQALEKRTGELKQKEAQLAVLESKVEKLKAKHAYFETVAARLEALELRNNYSVQITAERSLLWQK